MECHVPPGEIGSGNLWCQSAIDFILADYSNKFFFFIGIPSVCPTGQNISWLNKRLGPVHRRKCYASPGELATGTSGTSRRGYFENYSEETSNAKIQAPWRETPVENCPHQNFCYIDDERLGTHQWIKGWRLCWNGSNTARRNHDTNLFSQKRRLSSKDKTL